MNKSASKTETITGIFILLILAAVAAGVYFSQFQMNPALRMPNELPSHQQSPGAEPVDVSLKEPLVALPPGLSVMTPSETFDEQTLSDKINGKAELYLSAGFQGLRSQRFVMTESPDQWIELYAYDMANSRNAFAVYSMQRREDAVPLNLATHAYRTENGLFFVHGPHYMEIIGSDSSAGLIHAAQAAAESFVAGTSVVTDKLNESDLFPVENLDTKSITLLSSDAFGFERLDQVYTAVYRLRGGEVTAFLSRRGDEAAAAELVEMYHGFLLENGGLPLPDMAGLQEAKVVDILGGVEVIFNRGPVFAGIHDAVNSRLAEEMAIKLERRLAEDENGN